MSEIIRDCAADERLVASKTTSNELVPTMIWAAALDAANAIASAFMRQ